MNSTAAQMPGGLAQTPQYTVQDNKSKEKETNRIKKFYDNLWNWGGGRWVISIVVLGLSAAIVAKTPTGSQLRAAAAYTLSVAALHFFFIAVLFVKPRSPTDPRPPNSFIFLHCFSGAAWAASFVVMFVMRSNDETFEILDKRGFSGLGKLGELASNTTALLQNITIAAGVLGVAIFIILLLELVVVVRLFSGKFTAEEIAEGYDKITKDLDKSCKEKTAAESGPRAEP